MIKKLLLIVLVISVSACSKDITQNQNSNSKAKYTTATEISSGITTTSANPSNDGDDEGMTNAINARRIYINGNIFFIDSITPSDDVVLVDGEYISIYSGDNSRFAHLLCEESFIGRLILVDDTPQNELESDFYSHGDVYSDGNEIIIISESLAEYMESVYKYSEDNIAEKVKPACYNFENVFSIYPVDCT